jgi:hypothetical protein
MAKRVDSSDWSAARPAHGSSTSDFKNWSKQNPNRIANARERLKEFKEEPTTSTIAGTQAREEVVAKWKESRPVAGKGTAKSDQEKEAKRQTMIQWAKWNPNKATNARRVTGATKSPKAPVKKATPMKKGKKK